MAPLDPHLQQLQMLLLTLYKLVLSIISSQPFYTTYVSLPPADQVNPFIGENPKFASYFGDALDAIDGTHINACPSAAEADGAQNRKGQLMQNCLAACTWDMWFVYFLRL
ncbi:hypothetical protein OH76DRAFT_1423696 [Lentinus brumalis]|uniref:Uncharacterized protein n=1 Tax=Lentinus brumalis TaxID=2498619 RepID=A0A371CJH9_9APHY|nr:hypothetical protein OH76DRAFT_1423696 [Polyporus brumalis]